MRVVDLPNGFRFGEASHSDRVVHITEGYRASGEPIRFLALCGERLHPQPVSGGDVCVDCEQLVVGVS